MSRKLTQLPDFSYTSLDFDTILDETKALIANHPEYSDSWDDFLSSNAGMMLLELFSFVVEKYCSRIDWISRQLFLSTATDRQAVINILKLINHRPSLPVASKVNVTMKLTKWIEPFYLQGEVIYAPNLNGTMSSFTLLDNDEDGYPDYNYRYFIDTGTEDDPVLEFYNIPFYQGQTVIEDDIYTEGYDNEYIQLNSSPVIEDSIRLYSLSRNLQELPQVESFISPEAQQNDVADSDKLPPYIIEINSDNQVTIKWGSSSLVKIPSKGERMKVIYRIGGGPSHNIVANSITMTKSITDDSGRRASMIFSNPNPGFGGADAEDLDTAKLVAPISLRSANKTVTVEDYISHLEDSSYVMKANVIGKENEPSDLEEDVGYTLPPLDTWIYVVPNKDNWETYDPANYNKEFQIGRPFTKHGEIAREDIQITSLNQAIYLTKYRKYKGYTLYVTLQDNSSDNAEGMYRDSYIEDTDYTLDDVTGLFTRITTADGGSIPAGDHTLRIRYVYDSTTAAHKAATCMQFGSNNVILLDTTGANKIYPAYGIKITDIFDKTTYTEGTDYTIDYAANTVKLTSGSKIGTSSKVIVYYANGWYQGQNDTSEEKTILNLIKDKKMICVDNYIKDTVYSTFDVAATIYCSKNLIKTISNSLENTIRAKYCLNKMTYNTNINKSDIIKDIMAIDGVQTVEITYLGRNYEEYRRYLLGTLTKNELTSLDADTVDHKIVCKYNEIFSVSNDEYEGYESTENKRHGLIFEYNEY